MKKYALVSVFGNVFAETTLCQKHFTTGNVLAVTTSTSLLIKATAWEDVTDKTECKCIICKI